MRLWPLFIFWCLWFLNFSTRTVFVPLLPLIEDNLSLSHGQAGGLFTSLSIGYGLALFISGRFVSVWGHKRIVAFGFFGVAVDVLLFQWVEQYWALHPVFFLTGVSLGTYLPSIIPIITETYDHKHWGKALGMHDSAASFALFTTPLLVAFSLHFFSWRSLLIFFGVASLLLPVYFWKIAVEPKKQITRENENILDVFQNRTVWILGLLWIVANGCCNGIFSILPLYLTKERGFDFNYANTLLGISRAGGLFATVIFGLLCDRYGFRKILKVSIFGTGVGTIGIALVQDLPFLVVILILQAMVGLGFYPAAFAAASKLTSVSERAMAMGVILAFGVVFGTGATPLILGAIADHSSFKVGILGVGVVTTLSTLMVRALKETEEEKAGIQVIP